MLGESSRVWSQLCAVCRRERDGRELLRVSVEADGFDTLGGFVYQRLGRIPSTGDAVEYDGLRIEVVSTSGRRLKRLRVTSSARPDGSSSATAT